MREALLTDREKTDKSFYGSCAPCVGGREVTTQSKDRSRTRQGGGASMRSKIAFGSAMLVLVAALFGVVGPAVQPASAAQAKTGSTGKTAKQCDGDLTGCKKGCDKSIIDIGNAVQHCKDLCTDAWVNCTPLSSSHTGELRPQVGPLQIAPPAPVPPGGPRPTVTPGMK